MLTRRVIPCLDFHAGRVVKGVRFQNLRDSGDPVELARVYETQGADELVMLDVSATPEERGHAHETIANVRKVLSIPLSVGGGVRTVNDAEALLDAGADKVASNTAAFENPALVTEMAQRFGSQCTVVAIDAARVNGGWEVVTHSGRNRTARDAIEWARDCEQCGAGEILLTSWDRDGTRSGYDVELLNVITRSIRIPVIASGGAASPEHLIEALCAGADAVLAASIFHDGDYEVSDIKQAMASASIPVRI